MCSLATKRKKKFLPSGPQKVESAKENSKIHPNDIITFNRLKNIRILKASPMDHKDQNHALADWKLLRKLPCELRSSINSLKSHKIDKSSPK